MAAVDPSSGTLLVDSIPVLHTVIITRQMDIVDSYESTRMHKPAQLTTYVVPNLSRHGASKTITWMPRIMKRGQAAAAEAMVHVRGRPENIVADRCGESAD